MSVFPTPVIFYQVEIEEEEKLYLLKHYPKKVKRNSGNWLSVDKNVLEKNELSLLKERLVYCVNDAFNLIHSPLHECNLFITQSWINFSDKGQHHPPHLHSNSFYSAVLYVKVSEGDSIIFHNLASSNFDMDSTHHGLFNSKTWSIPVKDNLLLIFPSSLFHSVPTVEHSKLRVSLSFNTFIKGEIGSSVSLNKLVL